MIYDSLFESRAVSIGRQSDRNGSETQSESRDEHGIIPRVKEESVRNEGSYTPLTVGVLCPADNPLKMINDYPFEMIYVLSL